MTKSILPFLGLLFCFQIAICQSETEKGLNSINKEVLRGQLEFLASDWMEGRNTAEKGAHMAADYIASMFRVYGVKPGGDKQWVYPSRDERTKGMKSYEEQTYFQNFPLIEYSEGEEQVFSIIEKSNQGEKKYQLGYKTDFSVNIANHGLECTAPVVFVGYGYINAKNKYDDFKGLDIKGKVIVRLSGLPGINDKNSKAYEKFAPKDWYASRQIRNRKNEIASKKGALAIIEISLGEDNTLNWAQNTPFHYKSENYQGPKIRTPYKRLRTPGEDLGNNLTRITLTPRAINKLFEGHDFNLNTYVEKAAKLEKQKNFNLNKSVHLKTSVNSRIVKARNVIGVIEGKKTDEFIIIGAHYDHLGIKNGFIYNGADDNGSGTVTIMSVAKALMATGKKPDKTIIISAWTGEEKGLIGSRYFCDNPTIPLEQIKFYANYDMVSRNVNDPEGVTCSYTYSQSHEELKDISEEHIKDYGLNLKLKYRAQVKPGGRSDHGAFSHKQIPITSMITGLHDNYHTPRDVVQKTNYDKMYEIVKLAYLNTWRLSNDSELLKKK